MEQANKSEFTIKQFLELVKRSGVKILIFCLIAAFVMGVTTIGVYFGHRNSVANMASVIEYNYEGADEGTLPNSTERLNASGVKSVFIIDNALTSLKAHGTELAPSATEIANNITVSGIVPNEIAEALANDPTLSYFPTQYKVEMSNVKGLRLTQKNARLLLNEVVSQYIEHFKKTYIKTNLISDESIKKAESGEIIGTGILQKDYFQVCEILENEINSAMAVLSDYREIDSTFRANASNKTFDALINELRTIKTSDLEWCKFYVTNNGISIDHNMLISYYEEQISVLTERKDGFSELSTALKTEIENYKFSESMIVTEKGPVQVVSATEEYDNLYKRMVDAIVEENNLAVQIAIYENYKKKYEDGHTNNTPQMQQEVTERIMNIAKGIRDVFIDANATVTEFTEAQMGRAIIINIPATTVAEDGNILLIMLIADILVVLAAAAIAVLVTHIKTRNVTTDPVQEKVVAEQEKVLAE